MKILEDKYLQTIDRKKISRSQIALSISFAVGIFLFLSALIFPFIPQTYLNGFLKTELNATQFL